MSKYIGLFTREARQRLERAVDVLSRQGEGGLKDAVGEFHAVKGAALTLGFDAFAKVAAACEKDGRVALAGDAGAQAEVAARLLGAAKDLLLHVDDPQRMRS